MYCYLEMVACRGEATWQGPMDVLALIDNEHWGSTLQGPMKSRSYLTEAQGIFVSLLPGFHGST